MENSPFPSHSPEKVGEKRFCAAFVGETQFSWFLQDFASSCRVVLGLLVVLCCFPFFLAYTVVLGARTIFIFVFKRLGPANVLTSHVPHSIARCSVEGNPPARCQRRLLGHEKVR